MNKKIIAVSVLIAVLFVSSIAGTIFYYNGVVNDRNSKIVSLNNQVTNLTHETTNQNNEIANLTSQIENLTNPYIETQLGVTNIGGTSPYAAGANYWRLFIQGSAFNIGNSTAYNAGLKVIAYSDTGVLEINMTVPFVNGYNYGTTSAIVSSLGTLGPLQLGNLKGEQYAIINLNIYYESVVATWTVTPVWTNTP